jgi:hypothetical protein
VFRVQATIRSEQHELAGHPFLQRLERGPAGAEHARRIAADLTFWVMTFQDVLRMNLARVQQPLLAQIAQHHLEEDAGHEVWFWRDAQRLSAVHPPEWYFGPEHAPTREVSLEILGEVFRACSDGARLALILALEGAGAEFFGRVVAYFERAGVSDGLMYFADAHRQVEQSHSVFDVQAESRIDRVELSDAVLGESLGVVRRVFQSFHRLSSVLEKHLWVAERDAEQRAG